MVLPYICCLRLESTRPGNLNKRWGQRRLFRNNEAPHGFRPLLLLKEPVQDKVGSRSLLGIYSTRSQDIVLVYAIIGGFRLPVLCSILIYQTGRVFFSLW